MKKKMLILITCMFLFTFQLFSQDKISVIKTNPLGLVLGKLNMTYELSFKPSSSVLIDLGYRYRIFGVKVNTIGFGAAYRFYLSEDKDLIPDGLYINPQAGASIGSTVGQVGFTLLTAGAELGYQLIWDSGFAIDLGVGANLATLIGNVAGVGFSNTSGVLPSATLAVGYAF